MSEERSLDRLVDLAEQVGGEAWPYLLEHTIVDAWVGLIVYGVLMLAFLSLSIWLIKKKVPGDIDRGFNDLPFELVVAGISLIVALGPLGSAFFTNVVTLIAPEGAALRHILGG